MTGPIRRSIIIPCVVVCLAANPAHASGTPGDTILVKSGIHAEEVTLAAPGTIDADGISGTDRPPVVIAPATVTVDEGSSLAFWVRATDPDGEPVRLTADLSHTPAGMNFRPDPGVSNTGWLVWVPTYWDAGEYTVSLIATNSLTGTATTHITVRNTDLPPVVTVPWGVSVAEAGQLSVHVKASDPDGDAIASLTADYSGMPEGNNATFVVDADGKGGTLRWTPGYADAGTHWMTFIAGNAQSGESSLEITVTNTDRAPAVSAPAAATVAEGSPVSVTVHAADIDHDAITLTANLSGLPAGHNAVFTRGPGDSTGTLTWTPSYADAGTRTVTFTAANALSASASTVITVTNVDRAPTITAPATVSSPEATKLVVTVNVADPDGQPITSLLATGLPPGATFVAGPGNTTGTLTWTPSYFQAGNYPVRFLTAAGGLSTTAITAITITNLDRAPVVAAPAAASVSETSPITITVHAADADGEPITALSANLSVLPPGHNAIFSRGPGDSTGTLTWTPTYADSGSYSIVFTAANAIPGSSTTVIRVTNVDRAPSIAAPVAASVAEGSPLSVTLHAADIDGDAISLTASGLPAGNTAVITPGPGNSTATFTWTPTYDDAGSYNVTFTAANALSASTNSTITVTNTDRAPVVIVPAAAFGAEADVFTLTVHAADLDGQPLASLVANLSGLPTGHNAFFSTAPGDSIGTLTWVPTYADAGSYTVTFSAANVLTGSASAVIDIANTDRAPTVSAPAAATVAEAEPVSITVHAADIDLDAITALTVAGLPAGASAVFTPGPGDSTGTLIWTPSYDDAGTHTITFTAANALSGTASTVVTVTNVDRAPTITAPATVSSPEATTLVLTVNAADPDGDPLSPLIADLTGMPPGVTYAVNPENTTGTVSFTPNYFQAGSYKVTFFTGAGGLPATATTMITITNLDRAPVVTAQAAASVAEAGSVSVTVHATDADLEPITSLTAAVSPQPPGGGPVFTADSGDSTGTLTWTPGYFDSGTYTVTFTAANAIPGTASTAIVVSNVDRAPAIAAPAAVATAEASPVSVTVHAIDIDAESMSLVANLSGLPAGNDAVFTPGPGDTTGTLTWTPSYDHAGSYTVTFTAANALSVSASTVITVANVDRAPVVAVPATLSLPEASPLVIVVHAADPDGQPLASLVLSGLPAGATFTAGPGDTTGTLSWNPGYFDAGTYTVTFTAANALSGTASTVITVTNVDRAPLVAAPAAVAVAEAGTVSVTVHTADLDGEPMSLTAGVSPQPPGGTPVFTAGPGDTTGTLTWTPGYFDAGTYIVTFTAANAITVSAATVITVSNVDRGPVVTAPAAVSGFEVSPITFTVQAGDPDGEAITMLTADLAGLPADNDAVFEANPENTGGTLTWTPTYEDSGSYTVKFAAFNFVAGTANVVIHVGNVDRAPILAAPATASGPEAGALTVAVHATDPDGDAIASLAANLSALPAGAIFTAAPGNTSGTLAWTPGYDAAGSYGVTFTAANAMAVTATTALMVSNVDRAPAIAAPSAAVVTEASPFVVTVHVADPDGDGISSLIASGLPPGATFTPDSGDTTGTLAWTPGYGDAGSYTVTLTAANALTASASIGITVSNVDRAPIVAAPATASVLETGALSVRVHAADPDGDPIASLTANLSGLPLGAAFAADPGDTSGTLSWTPGYSDAGNYTVSFAAANALSGSASTAITVGNVDRAPAVTAPATASVAEGSPLTVVVNAADVDGEAIASLTASGLPPGATFTPGAGNATGTLAWTPGFSAAGSYTVTFTAANALSGSANTVITVSNVDRAPVVAAPATVSALEGSPFTVRVHAADPDGQPLSSLNAFGLPAGATFSADLGDTTGTLSWTPGYSHAGSYTVTFTAANALSGSASTVIAVANVDRAPIVAAPAAASVAEASALTFTVHAADPDGQPLTLTASGLPAGAAFTTGPGDTTGTLSWTPGYGTSSSYSVTFIATNALSGSASTLITVSNVDRAPAVAAPAIASIVEGALVTVLVHAADADGDPIASLTASNLPPGATFTPGAGDTTGTLSWVPGYAAAGSYAVVFTAANALTGSAGTVIVVIDSDQPPAIVAPTAVNAPEAQAVTIHITAADADGESIASLAANLSSLPAGNNAVFTPGPGNTTGTLTWTPTYADAGTYAVIFTAANAIPGTATTLITVHNADRAPALSAPASVSVLEAGPLTVTVQTSDVDGEPITSLTADLTGLPAGNNAVFTAGPGNATGTLTWTPTYADSGTYAVAFTAANALSASVSTAIHVINVDDPNKPGTFFVDVSSPACSDVGNGTQAQPYCTISAAVAAHNGPGTTIIVKPGSYREQVTVPSSGTSNNPMVIRASASGVVIDGADDYTNPAQWVQYSGNVWLAASVGWTPKQVFADGTRLTASSGQPANLTPGTYRSNSGGLYVNVGGGNPATHQVRVGRRNFGFLAAKRGWVTINGFTVTRTEDTGIYLDLCENATVTGNTVTFTNKYGIQATGGLALVIGSNTVSDNNDHGISLTTGVAGSTLEDNESFRNARPGQRAANGIYIHGSSGNVVRRNRLHDNQDTGLHLQNGANNSVCYLNRSWNNGDHGYDHLGATGTLHVCDVAYGNYKDGFSIEGNSGGSQLYNCVATDNGLTTNEFDLWVDQNSSSGFVSDYNLFWNSTSQPPVKYIATLYSSVAAYAAASGRDGQSLQADPRFVNPAAGDFHLLTGSPAIDNANSGVPQWPATDAEGHARADDPTRPNAGIGPVAYGDRGAFEYRPAQLTITPSSGTAPLAVTASAAGSVGPNGTVASFRFDFGDGTVVGPQAGATATHTYGAGNWTATVTVTDQGGGTSTASAAVSVNARPTAALTATPATGSAPLTVSLNASASTDSDGQIVSYQFNFGDGASGAPQSSPIATHSYGTGTWAPIVTITDNLGATAAASSPAAVAVGLPNVPPIAKAGVTPTSGTAPLVVTADASQSSDPDGAIVSYRFDFGDGQFVGPQATATASHTYAAGNWPLTVTVVDDDGGTSSMSTLITSISDLGRAPAVAVAPSVTVAEASPLVLTVHAADPDGQAITSLTADLSGLPAGSGAIFTTAPGDSVGTLTWSPTYSHAGSYTVTFTAANALTGTASTVITVQNVDRAPAVTAPAAVNAGPGTALTIHVSAADADGNAITSLTANLSGLPAGNAAFVAGPGNTTGTLTWTPAPGDSGSYVVSFTASNALSGSAITVITVREVDGAPVVTAPAAVAAAEGSSFAVTVHARDLDGDPIQSLTANLTGLPPGNNAAFAPGPGDTTGTLTWTPTYKDAGSYTVTFTASNALSGTAATVITVASTDRAPVVTAPAAVSGHAGAAVTVHVTASDPDGQPIASFTANLSGLPAGSGATFTAGAGDTTGTLSWTPAAGDLGNYNVTFTASNALSGSATTSVSVTPSNQAPTAVLAATPATGNEPLNVVADASGSSDGDGTIVSYRFDFGDGTVVGPQSEATASHAYAAGNWNLSVVVTDEDGGVNSAVKPILVAAVGGGPNLVSNPSFEVNTTGWDAFPGSTIQRVAGGFDGNFSLLTTGPDSLSTFGINDSPNWVTTTPAAGTRYRFNAWVRAASSGGQARLRVREYQGLVRIGATGYFSNVVGLSPTWKSLNIDYVTQQTGTTLDLQVEDVPISISEQFQIDNVSIRIVPGASPARAGVAPEIMAPLGAVSAENSVIDLNAGDAPWKVRIQVATDADGEAPRFSRLALRYQEREIAAAAITGDGVAVPMEVLFDRRDLRTLFAGLPAGRQAVMANVIGERIDGTAQSTTLAADVLGAPEPLRPILTPNPMRTSGWIGFATSRAGMLQADIFDASGRRVRRLMSPAEVPGGWHDLSVDGRDEGGAALSAGVYFYRIVSVDGVATGRLVLLR